MPSLRMLISRRPSRRSKTRRLDDRPSRRGAAAEEAARIALVARGAAFLLDPQEDGVAVAVDVDGARPSADVPRSRPSPRTPAATGSSTSRSRSRPCASNDSSVHVGEHQDGARGVVLTIDGNECRRPWRNRWRSLGDPETSARNTGLAGRQIQRRRDAVARRNALRPNARADDARGDRGTARMRAPRRRCDRDRRRSAASRRPEPGDLTFLANPKYAAAASPRRARRR